jgi:predicted esterase
LLVALGALGPPLPSAVAAPPPVAPPPAAAPSGTQPLPLAGFLPALVSWPDTQRWPQPVLIAAHGAGDDPETHCELWRRLLGQRGVILCLRGRPMARGAGGYFFSDHHSLKREVLAALEALQQVAPGKSDTSRSLYAGYSQGAQMGLLMLADDGARAPRLLLVEGGSGDFGALRVARFRRTGGQAVAFVCGTPGCNQRARRSRERLEKAGLRASTAYVPGAGHTYLGEMVPKLVEAFDFLTKDDRRWSPRSEGSAPVSSERGGS